ncbi:Phage shock protein PspC (stress-responsive transcriptional regulator) [Asanoa hainanensis]|uniref:Phage shock protein PspC (Stress-responsive transcriptional regulator) n=1 Tax=Asanoa hainanensis TaxID=560556 RepID=A0A239I148_9ACTN|nr:Phage shock protein PspC (stress-responsive transcriptional regulator) [Asanoa hainanensis]
MTTSANPPYKQLRRTTDDKIIAGVCGGLGRYFGVDPVLMRVIFAVTVVLTGGLALLAYPVLWFLMPEDRDAAGTWGPGGGAPADWQAQTRGGGYYQPPTYQGPTNQQPGPQASYVEPTYPAPDAQPPTTGDDPNTTPRA